MGDRFGWRARAALRGVGAALVAAAAPVVPAAVVAVPAHADPEPPAPEAPVPTVEQVVADLNRITDPGVPCPDKADVVEPAFTPQECLTIDDHLNRFDSHGLIPFTFVVTDIQPAPDDYAGATLSVPRPFSPPGPIVLVRRGDQWKITHDTAMTALNALWFNATGGGPTSGGPPLAPFAPMPGRLGS